MKHLLIQIIGSGSTGNAYKINDGNSALLLDAGLPFRKIQEAIGFTASLLSGALITHVVHPLNLFNPDICQELYYFGQKLLNTNTQVCYNTLEANNLTVIYGANKILYKFLNEHFRNPRFFAQNTPLIAYYSQKSKEGNTKKMFVHIQAETMHLFCLNKGKLLLTNAFNASETSNQVYYILYIWKQLTYSQERDELFLSGNLEDKTNLLDAIKKYIANVSVLNPSEYLDLKAMNLCEL